MTSSSEFQVIADTWKAAYNGTDAGQLAPFYSQDAQYISGHVPGLVASGRESLIANFQAGMNMGGHIDQLEILSAVEAGELANVLCAYHADNAGQKVSGRTLLLFRKVDDKWLIYLHMTVV